MKEKERKKVEADVRRFLRRGGKIDRTNARGCSMMNCPDPVHSRGLCRFHYERQRNGIELKAVKRADPYRGRTCKVKKCRKQPVAQTLCAAHYYQLIRKPKRQPKTARRKGVVHYCSTNECNRIAHARGWCKVHYNYWRRGADPTRKIITNGPLKMCCIADCDRERVSNGMCDRHNKAHKKKRT